MDKKRILSLLLILVLTIPALPAGERSIPVDIYLLVDKSLSMAEPGKYDSLRAWVQDQLLGQIVIDGDWVSIYQFYGQTDHLVAMQVADANDRKTITDTFARIKPDGQYTDIGQALDTLKAALDKRGTTDRYTIMLLLTDLKQEAPWTSRYAGIRDTFESPYLAEARMIKHDAWYEITLDMGIQNRVVSTSKLLYTSLLDNKQSRAPRTLPATTDSAGDELQTDGSNLAPGSAASGTAASGTAGNRPAGDIEANGGDSNLLPFPLVFVVISTVVAAGITASVVIVRNRRRKEDETHNA
jgi:hypothetical protein